MRLRQHLSALKSQHQSHELLEKIKTRVHSDACSELLDLELKHTFEGLDICAPDTPRWKVSTINANLSLTGLKSQKACTSDRVLKHLFNMELNTKWNKYKPIFTDGSTTEESSSFGIFIPFQQKDIAYRLPRKVSSTKAELAGIFKALEELEFIESGKYVICTDSKSSLQAILRKSHKTAFPRLVAKIHNLLEVLDHAGYQWRI